MDKKLLQITCIILCMFMAAALAACQPTAGNANTGSITSEGVNSTSDNTTTSSIITTTTPEEPTPPTPITLFISQNTDFIPESNAVVKALEELTNTKLTFEIPPQANYRERLQIVLASKDLPDTIQIESPNDDLFVKAISDGLIMSITEQIEKSTYIEKHINPASWESMRVTKTVDIYGLPRNTLNRADGYSARKDWLDAVGLSVPDDGIITLDEFTEILRRFTYNDPDGNGIDDTYGLFLEPGQDGRLEPHHTFLPIFGILGWQEYTDEPYQYMNLVYSKSKNNYKEALSYTQMLWKDGLIDPNWPNNAQQADTRFLQGGIVGVASTFANIYANLNTLKENHPDADIAYITRIVRNEGDTPMGVGFGGGFWWFTAVTSAAKDKVDEVVKFFDDCLSDEGYLLIKHGIEGVHYTKNTDGSIEKIQPAYDNYYKERGGLLHVRRYLDIDTFIATDMPTEIREKSLKWIDICANMMVMSKDRGFEPEAGKNPAYMDYDKLRIQDVSKIVTGALDVDEWDRILEGWYAAGGEDYIMQMNEYIKEVEARENK